MEQEIEERETEEDLFLTAKVVTDETFSCHKGFDLAVLDKRNPSLSDLTTFHVLKGEIYSVFKSRIAQHFCYPESQIKLWVLAHCENKTVQPDTHISENFFFFFFGLLGFYPTTATST